MVSITPVDKLIWYIRSKGILPLKPVLYGYRHMGATLTDAILQAGLNYASVVGPRVSRIIHSFPHATTTSRFLDLIDKFGANYLLDWNHPEKPTRLIAIANFFYVRSVETENCLREWLQKPCSESSLRSIRGVGPKTVDYLKILVGIPAIAVDRHINEIVGRAGVNSRNYVEIRNIVEEAADRLKVNRTSLDYAIWVYASQTGPPRR